MSPETFAVVTAARALVEQKGKPGAMARWKTLQTALKELRRVEPVIGAVIAAALAEDRYGRAGAGEAVHAMTVALTRLDGEAL